MSRLKSHGYYLQAIVALFLRTLEQGGVSELGLAQSEIAFRITPMYASRGLAGDNVSRKLKTSKFKVAVRPPRLVDGARV
jgi:hypothetical protein